MRPTAPRYRIFLSSPGDVLEERRAAALVIDRLAREYARFLSLEPYLWEYEPMLASGHFQDIIEPPSRSDLVIVILWSRLGTPLPVASAQRRYTGGDGRTPVTGTEWEFEEALAARRQRGAPDLLTYRKTAEAQVPLNDAERRADAERQWDALQAFWRRHFADRGEFRAAFAEFEALTEFADKLEADLRRLIEQRIADQRRQAGGTALPVLWPGNPFRGLQAYGLEHAPVYFGRNAAIHACVQQLRRRAAAGCAFLLVLGASGAGKSSLVQAGLLPALMVPGVVSEVGAWRHAILRPSGHAAGPFAALAQSLVAALPELTALLGEVERIAETLRHSAAHPDAVVDVGLNRHAETLRARRRLLPHQALRLVLVVDQLEELYTGHAIAPQERQAFIDCLAALAAHGRVDVIATLRSDHWHHAAETPALIELARDEGRYDLLAPGAAELAEMIRRPAEVAGLHFESDPVTEIGLEARLAEEAAAQPGALPLLSFLLDALYVEDVERGGGDQLCLATAQAHGGLQGAIAQRAEDVLQAQPAPVQAELPRLLRALVTVGGAGGPPTGRAAALDDFPVGSPIRALVDAFLAPQARLLVAEGDGQQARVRLAHEALLSHWRRARELIRQDRRDLETRTRLEELATLHRERTRDGASRGYPLTGLLLAEGEDLLARWRADLSAPLVAYIEASGRAARRRRRQLRALVAGVILGLAGLAGIAGWQADKAQREAERADAQAQAAIAQRDRAWRAESRHLAAASETLLARGDATAAAMLALRGLPSAAEPDRPWVKVTEAVLYQALNAHQERAIFDHHSGPVEHVAFSPDGTRLVTASHDGTARLLDLAGNELAVLKEHDGSVKHVAFSSDGTRLATASWDGTARLWDLAGNELAVLGDFVRVAGFSPDGTQVVTGHYDGTARLWDLASNELVVLEGHDRSRELLHADFSPDGMRVVTASLDKTARLWDLAGNQLAVLAHDHRVFHAAFNPDGTRLVTASGDGRLWDLAGNQLAVLAGHDGPVLHAAFSPDGTRVVTASLDGTARLWDLAGNTQAVLAHDGPVNHAAFSPDGMKVVTASDDGMARLWDLEGNQLAVMAGHDNAVNHAAFSPDGTWLVTVSDDGTARLWNLAANGPAVLGGDAEEVERAFGLADIPVETTYTNGMTHLWDLAGNELAVLPAYTYFAAYSPDGSRLVTSTSSLVHGDDTARLWDLTGTEFAVLEGHDWSVKYAEFSPDGTQVVTASDDGTARLWDLLGNELAVLAHDGQVNHASFRSDGTQVVTASNDGTARLWDLEGNELAVLAHDYRVYHAAFNPDGTRLITASGDGTARLWDLAGKELAGKEPEVLAGHDDWVNHAAFSPDGMRVATASGDGTARLWDLSGNQQAVLAGHDKPVHHVAFSSDGMRLVTVSSDNTARVWRVLPSGPDLIEYAESVLPANRTLSYALLSSVHVLPEADRETKAD